MVHIDTDTTTKPGVVRLLVRGELDLAAKRPFTEALACAVRLRRPVEVDLVKVDFIDGSGLSMLMEARRRALSAGRLLTIVEVSRCVRRLIEITNTTDSLPPLPSRPDGREAPVRQEMTGEALGIMGAPAFRT
jgi:anti-anti-sigma factor